MLAAVFAVGGAGSFILSCKALDSGHVGLASVFFVTSTIMFCVAAVAAIMVIPDGEDNGSGDPSSSFFP